jgi:cytochrome c556
MRPFVQNGTGSLAAVQAAAETLASHNGKYQALWPRGTELGVAGSKTRPELWQQTDRLNQLIADMERNATAMAVAARSGDAGQIRTAFGGVVGSCNACHDAYQSR